MPVPRVDVVIVSWNTRDELLECVESVLASSGVTSDVVVVDNASSDGSAEAVSSRFGRVSVVRNRANLGFARASNQGIVMGTAPWVLLLNPDARVEPDGIARLVARMERLPRHGILVPRLIGTDGGVSQSAFPLPSLLIPALYATGVHRMLPRRWRQRLLLPGSWGSDVERDVPWALGAAMLARRAAVDEVGLLDESFFVYAEDLEWCDRMWSHGWRVRFTPDVAVVHHGNRSGAQRFGAQRTEEYLRNTMRFARRRRGVAWARAYHLLNAAAALRQAAVLRYTTRLFPSRARDHAQAYWRNQSHFYLRRTPPPSPTQGTDVKGGRRLLVLTGTYPPQHVGGYELLCRDHVSWRRGRGDDVTVLTSTWGLADGRPREERGAAGELVLRELTLPWENYVLTRPAGRELWTTERSHRRALDRAVTRSRPDAVVVWSMAGITKSLLARVHELGLPLMLVIHEGWPTWDVDTDPWARFWATPAYRPLSRALKPVVRAAAQRIVAPWNVHEALEHATPVYCSEALRDDVEDRREEFRGRGVVVHDGIDATTLSRPRPDDEPLHDPVRLLHAGRVEKRKGVHAAVAAVARLRGAGVRARLRIVGWRDETYAADLRDLARRLGVEADIDWDDPVGHEQMPDIYRAADVLLFPTAWREPFGLVPLEAMATGCLVVATGLGGSGEFLRDQQNSILIGVNDDRAAGRAVERLLGDLALVARLRAGGRDTVERFSLAAFATGLDTVLDGLTAGA